MKNFWNVGFIIIASFFILLTIYYLSKLILFPLAMESYAIVYNSRIDYSCNLDSDCEMKIVGDGICDSAKNRCVNKDSISGKRYSFSEINCLAFELWPNKCSCENNKCVSYACRPDECVIMK